MDQLGMKGQLKMGGFLRVFYIAYYFYEILDNL